MMEGTRVQVQVRAVAMMEGTSTGEGSGDVGYKYR